MVIPSLKLLRSPPLYFALGSITGAFSRAGRAAPTAAPARAVTPPHSSSSPTSSAGDPRHRRTGSRLPPRHPPPLLGHAGSCPPPPYSTGLQVRTPRTPATHRRQSLPGYFHSTAALALPAARSSGNGAPLALDTSRWPGCLLSPSPPPLPPSTARTLSEVCATALSPGIRGRLDGHAHCSHRWAWLPQPPPHPCQSPPAAGTTGFVATSPCNSRLLPPPTDAELPAIFASTVDTSTGVFSATLATTVGYVRLFSLPLSHRHQ